MKFIKKIIYIFIKSHFTKNTEIRLKDLNFRKVDFTNYKQIKMFIFKKDFYRINNKYVQNFEFLNFSKNLGGKIGINLSKISIFKWYNLHKYKLGFPWSDDFTSKRLINIIYNYEFINSSSNLKDSNLLNKIILMHMNRIMLEFKYKRLSDISSYDIIGYALSLIVLKKKFEKEISFIEKIILSQVDILGMHKSYNILEHSKFLNNLNELKNILLYFNIGISNQIERVIIQMTSILNEYFHVDGTLPLFNGCNNNYTKQIYNSLNKDEYLKSRAFSETKNGIAFYSDKNKKIFFDIVQPNKNKISKNLSAGTLSFEFSSLGEKLITNCGASENFGKNPEYLRYSAAHSTIILQNTNISEIKENNPHLKYPQSVVFNSNAVDGATVFEGSHNGYQKKFSKIIKRKLTISHKENKIYGEDSFISTKKNLNRIIFHIRFHLMTGLAFNYTNNKKSIIIRSNLKNMWVFKSDVELKVEDSILVDFNKISPSKQIVIKGITSSNKEIRKWSLEKI